MGVGAKASAQPFRSTTWQTATWWEQLGPKTEASPALVPLLRLPPARVAESLVGSPMCGSPRSALESSKGTASA